MLFPHSLRVHALASACAIKGCGAVTASTIDSRPQL